MDEIRDTRGETYLKLQGIHEDSQLECERSWWRMVKHRMKDILNTYNGDIIILLKLELIQTEPNK